MKKHSLTIRDEELIKFLQSMKNLLGFNAMPQTLKHICNEYYKALSPEEQKLIDKTIKNAEAFRSLKREKRKENGDENKQEDE